jgi:UDP-GlcNAc:undecaprenyl-phosphate/decaprenyl-phosphate GlcNAc-1-phosphate transferase
MTAFPFNVYAAGAFAAFIVSLAALPFWRRWSIRFGFIDDPGHRKIHSTPIPLAGGWSVLTGIAVPLLLGVLLVAAGLFEMESLRHGVLRRSGQLFVVLLGAFGMAMLGSLDDKYELSPRVKFSGQFLIAAATALAGIRITLFVPSVAFSFAITVLWILTVTNALNFLDNMNGLCAGLGVIGAWACAWSAALQGQYLVALLGFVAFGALLGFLPYNYPRASAFLGDAGSHLVGYLLAVLAILPHFYSKSQPRAWAVLSPLAILAVPLLDMAWVVLHRWRIGQPFYVGDTNHISHRLVKRGLSKSTAVAVIWLMAAASSAVALLFLE